MLAAIPDDDVRAYVVWVPKSGGAAQYVANAARRVPDQRATHYWDEAGATMRAYTTLLELPEDAWDIYLLYGPEATWNGELPPPPAYWMHQLGSRRQPRVDGPYFDAHTLATETKKLLARPVHR